MQVHDYPLKTRHDDLLRAAPSRPAAPPGRRSSRRLNSWPRSHWFSLPTLVLVPSLAISAAIVATAPGSSALHVAPAWAWLLTGAQIAGMWLVGNSKPHGWLVGAVAQPAWITYAILSGQYGFIPGCAVSLVVQTWNFSPADRISPGNRLLLAPRSQSRLKYSAAPEPSASQADAGGPHPPSARGRSGVSCRVPGGEASFFGECGEQPISPTRDLGRNLTAWLLGCAMVYLCLFGTGKLLLHQPVLGLTRRSLRRRRLRPPPHLRHRLHPGTRPNSRGTRPSAELRNVRGCPVLAFCCLGRGFCFCLCFCLCFEVSP